MGFDEEWFRSIGIDAPKKKIAELGLKVYEELELRVGNIIAARLTDSQLSVFEGLVEANQDEDQRIEWLDKNFPSYKKLVSQEEKRLRGENSQQADKVVFINSFESAT